MGSELIELKLIDVIYTLDGKEYITDKHLEKEILDELVAHGGRINVVDLQQKSCSHVSLAPEEVSSIGFNKDHSCLADIFVPNGSLYLSATFDLKILNVDLNYIEAKISELLKFDKSLLLVQGFLMSRMYLEKMCEEINDTLQEAGQLTVSDLTKEFGLPTAFLLEHIEESLGTRIIGRLDKTDSGVLYTESYVARYQARIRGQFSAITRPTSLGPIISQGNYHAKLFYSVLNDLISTGQLLGSIHGRTEKAVYIPEIYIKLQNSWVDSFLASNGYLEYDAISRLGIDSPQEYLTRRYGNQTTLLKLETCCVGQLVQTRVEAAIEEVQSSNSWVDIMTILPSPCTPADGNKILMSYCKSNPELRVFGMTAAASKAFVQTCFELFQPLIADKAQKAFATNAVLLTDLVTSQAEGPPRKDKKEERRKRGGTEKKGQRGKGADVEQEEEEEGSKRGTSSELHFMTTEEVAAFLLTKYPDCGEDFLSELAGTLYRRLQDAYLQALKALLSTTSNEGPSESNQRKLHVHVHANLQESIQGLWNRARLFQKAIPFFEGDSALQLSKYLLRTVCTDLLNMVFCYLSKDKGVQLPDDQKLTAKDRSTIILNLPENMRKSLKASNTAVNGKEKCVELGQRSRQQKLDKQKLDKQKLDKQKLDKQKLDTDIEEFLKQFEALCEEEFCGLMLKKLDKKKERQLLFSHHQSLLATLKEEKEPAMALHLITVFLFQRCTSCIIHAPGRLVPNIISFLAKHMNDTEYAKLSEYQRLVMLHLRLTSEAKQDDPDDEGEGTMEHLLPPPSSDELQGDPVQVMDELKRQLDSLKDLVVKPRKENE
eukprot:Em0001g1090a